MEIISKDELYRCFENEETIINKEINLKYIDLKFITTVRFENCNFTVNQLNFDNSDRRDEPSNRKVNITFLDCEFNNIMIMGINNIGIFNINNLKKSKSLKITNCKFDSLIFENNINIDYKIEINFCEFAEYFNFSMNTFNKNGSINFLKNTFQHVAIIKNNSFNNLSFIKQYFKDFLGFENTFLKDSNSTIIESEFKKASFSNSNFSTFSFNNCDFLDTTWFEDCKNITNSELTFVACKFDKYSLFDKSKFNKIEILRSKFLEKASFENFETNSFKIHQVTFSEAAYFDDLNKNNNLAIEKWDRKTIRAIKRELVNTHNQIDYLRFKAYELNAYKKEKGKNWKDAFILFFNKQSNNFGLSWLRGLRFTLLTGFICYLLYLITFAIAIKDYKQLPQSIEEFFVIFLNFLNPFSFLKYPIPEAEKYLCPFFFYLLGKIFISFGIYQTVQAFRKFGVNGG